MVQRYQQVVKREKLKFFLGLGLMLSLFYFSLLRQQQVAGYEFALLLSLTLSFLLFDYLKVSQFLELAKKYEDAHFSHETAIQSALAETLKFPLLLKLLKTELLALYYAFFASFERSGVAASSSQFSHAKTSNRHDVYVFVALSQLPFLPFIHVFVEYKIGPGQAWLITALTLWSVVWFLAQVEAAKFRPIELTDDSLTYRFCLSWAAEIPLSNVKLARSINVAEILNGDEMFLSPVGSTRNVLLEFETPICFSGQYFQKRREIRAAISVDSPSAFLSQLALNGVDTGQEGQLLAVSSRPSGTDRIGCS